MLLEKLSVFRKKTRLLLKKRVQNLHFFVKIETDM